MPEHDQDYSPKMERKDQPSGLDSLSYGARLALAVALFALLIAAGAAWALTRDSDDVELTLGANPVQVTPGVGGASEPAIGAPDKAVSEGPARSGGVSGDMAFSSPSGFPSASPSGAAGITTSGSASVAVTPDRVTWTFSIQATADTAKEAQDQAAAKAKSVIDALKDAGVRDADIETQSVSLNPNYDYNGQPPYRLVNYTASTSLVVETTLDGASELADRAVEAGADQFYGPSLTVADSERYYRQALKGAYEQARARAMAIADAAGVELGKPVSLSASDHSQPPVLFEARAQAADQAGIPIAPGQSEITASVSATFAIGE